MPRWLFVRHGESVANAEGWLAGHVDAGLTRRGEAQATALAGVLDLDGIGRVYASDSRRALETARLAVADRLPILPTPRLRERHLGRWEGRARRELIELGDWDVLLTWDRPPPGGECHLDVARRVIAFFAEIEGDDGVLVVSHAGALRCAIGVLDGMDPDAICRWQVPNATPITREIAPGTWARRLAALG